MKPILHACTLMLTLAACALAPYAAHAEDGRPGAGKLEHYTQAAGEPVPSFLLRGFRNFELLDRQHLVLHTRHNEAFLVSLRSPCRGLNEAWNIDIGAVGTRVYANSAVVRFESGSCRVDEIRPIDLALVGANAQPSA